MLTSADILGTLSAGTKLATRSAHFLHNFSVFSAFLNPFTNTTRSHLYRGQTLDKAKSENKSKQGGLWLEVFWFRRVRSLLIVMIQRGLEIFWVGILPGLRKCDEIDEIDARSVAFCRILSISSVSYVGKSDYRRFCRYCRYLIEEVSIIVVFVGIVSLNLF